MKMPQYHNGFQPAWWLPGAHCQTVWPTLFRHRPVLPLEKERVTLADGDFIDLAWLEREKDSPLVLILHGLEGSINSPYARGLMRHLQEAGFTSCFMHFRGCSGEPNRLDRSYHSGETGDVHEIVNHIRQRHQREVFAVVGFSLGGNVLLKWLGEQGDRAPLERAVAVSVPYRLADAAQRMNTGVSRIYQHHLLSRMKRKYRKKYSQRPSPLSVDIASLKTFRAFDDQVTAPLHGFSGVDDYYQRSSSRQFVPLIRVPTLLLHASDDPFMYPATVPSAEEMPNGVKLELAEKGGHVGFVSGPLPFSTRYFVDQRIIQWLREPFRRG